MTVFRISAQTEWLALRQPFVLESGSVLPAVDIAYRRWGKLSPAGDNAVIVCHALTGSADADEWWNPLFGPGRALDPEKDFIVCSNVLGSCYGSTGPTTPCSEGRPWGGRFPAVTLRDQVRAQILLADALGIRRIRLVVGGSMGGMQALEWAYLDPARVQAVATVAATARQSAWCLAWSEAQRHALAADPKYRDGHYDPADPPLAGLAAARAVAMISYRSPVSLAQRFDRYSGEAVYGERSRAPEDFAVKGWLRHHGQSLVERFDANSYRVLVNSLDSHDLARDRDSLDKVLGAIHQPTLVVSISSDLLYVPEEQRQLARGLPRGHMVEIDSEHGHDGFLSDAEMIEPILRRFLKALPDPNAEPAEPVRRAMQLQYTW